VLDLCEIGRIRIRILILLESRFERLRLDGSGGSSGSFLAVVQIACLRFEESGLSRSIDTDFVGSCW